MFFYVDEGFVYCGTALAEIQIKYKKITEQTISNQTCKRTNGKLDRTRSLTLKAAKKKLEQKQQQK